MERVNWEDEEYKGIDLTNLKLAVRDNRRQGSTNALQAPPIPSDPSPLKPTPAPPRKLHPQNTTQQHQRSKSTLMNLSMDCHHQILGIHRRPSRKNWKRFKDEALDVAPNAPTKDTSTTSVEDNEHPSLDVSMESIGIQATKLASLHFVRCPI